MDTNFLFFQIFLKVEAVLPHSGSVFFNMLYPANAKQFSTYDNSPPRWSSPCRGEGAYPPRSSRVRQRGELNERRS